MTAPFVTTVTKPAVPGSRSRLKRALLAALLLLPLVLAITLLAWMAMPRAEGDRDSWVDRLFRHGDRKQLLTDSVCSLPKETGPCRAAMKRYFYSTEGGTCEEFIYGGCEGNDNNFNTLDSCVERCVKSSDRKQKKEDSVCTLPKETGPCRAAMKRYFYSPESGTCEEFIYGGCEGNDNNFNTLDSCVERCVKSSDRKQQKKAEGGSVCQLSKEVGPCRGAMKRYFFNTETSTCEEFLYGGCDGNGNNFNTLDACNEHCVKSSDRKQHTDDGAAICSLPVVVGDCRAALPRYHYDAEQGRCKEFTYGGCGGNGNNFETLQACEDMCAASARSAESDCTSEPDGGNCYAYFERFAFRPASQTCEQFVYGGCGGNGNRYSSREECEQHCAGRQTGLQPEPEDPAEPADYDTKICGVAFCPADCTQIRVQGDCVYCSCGDSPEVVRPPPVPSPEA